ncbi:hypothetical protein HHK36_001746 [Tetracentron sinense]|uniref:Nudix hydrolase domain-containing protein n=1 Tax=Tetracentron sinense TaxID=13715 RepID=A0A834ZYM9_TETSI|nr:hypothetical protein HHK36_001746 [Tetracentron sinense]
MDSIQKLELEKKAYGVRTNPAGRSSSTANGDDDRNYMFDLWIEEFYLHHMEMDQSLFFHIIIVFAMTEVYTYGVGSSERPHGITCKENLLKECEEEAGIPRQICILSNWPFDERFMPLIDIRFCHSLFFLFCSSPFHVHGRNSLMGWKCLSHRAIPVGAVSYMDIDGYRNKRNVLFCYDLKLPDGFIPKNQGKPTEMQLPSIFDLCTFYCLNSHATDGEVASFKLISGMHVANIIRRTQFFKPNCSLVIIDFLFRHGY